jgi:hypothetical protein
MSKLRSKLTVNLKVNLNINSEENKIKWNLLWDQYSQLFKLLNINYDIDSNRSKKINTFEDITIESDKNYKAMGTYKIIKKIKFSHELEEYALANIKGNNFSILYNEIENHVELLYLYYKTFEEYKWKFNIPKIYRRDEYQYVMEYINLNPITIKQGKIYSHIRDTDILIDIGKFLGLYLIHNSKKFFDYELYYTLDNKVFILDYGFTQKVDLPILFKKREILSKSEIDLNCLYKLNEFMYKGMIEILNMFLEEEKENFDIICQISKIEEIFKFTDFQQNIFQQKYLKYKSKYLNLK